MTSLALQRGYIPGNQPDARRFKVFTRRHIDQIPQLERFSTSDLNAMKAVSAVLPFRVNNYVVEELIDWSNIPQDPMFQLTFPQPAMLTRRQRGSTTSRRLLARSGSSSMREPIPAADLAGYHDLACSPSPNRSRQSSLPEPSASEPVIQGQSIVRGRHSQEEQQERRPRNHVGVKLVQGFQE